MRNVRIYSYNRFSEGAKALAETLGVKRIKHENGLYRGRHGHTIINWGSGSAHDSFGEAHILNRPERITTASDKLAFFRHVSEEQDEIVRIPEWTDNSQTARGWVDAGCIVVARTVLRGHSGAGIKILELGVDFVEAPLYTKYVKKEKEFRVHFAFGRQIDLQRKIKDPAFVGEPNWRVRNHQNGFIYVRNDVQAPEDVERQALQAFTASGLDFGAVDVVWNGQQQKAYVLEINTAPGLAGQTVGSYADAFRQALS